MSPACGPATTVAMPEICPRSLMLLAEITERLDSAGISVALACTVIVCWNESGPSCCWSQRCFPTTTWPRSLRPVAKAAWSPGTKPRILSAAGCQRAAT